ncbi:hypothetical protein [Rossellomorea vietnamensis]|uniref:hypothetical protein n=1 Tax=Rossellomorea vietnamensis TaxID=218284 RepID=UPI0030930616|nr:hypothetical protein Q7C14_20655 [Rossellomorea vietnamensis]WQI95383.1 hypothetical protein Q7C14_20730 [Rossellomorea vietnamensis]
MHPITLLEITMCAVFILILFAITFLLPKKSRKWSFIIASSITLIVLSFFVIRPFWIDYQVSHKTEQLDHFLEKKYPNQEWEIVHQTGRQYNPYHLEVEFENEKGWTYTYSVVDEKNICQNAWTPSEGSLPKEGKHYERDQCE